MNHLWALALILPALIVPAEAQEFSEPTLYELVPADGSYPKGQIEEAEVRAFLIRSAEASVPFQSNFYFNSGTKEGT